MSQEELSASKGAEPRSPGADGQPKSRIRYIDVCRGLLFLFMTSSHAIGLLGMSPEHWIAAHGLPRGWASVCFICLSGFSVGLLFFPKVGNPKTNRHLVARGWHLIVVMFFSNILMLTSKFLLEGRSHVLRDPSWWIGLVTLRTTYSISSILLPTAVLLLVSPFLLRAIRRYSPWRPLVVLIAASLFLHLITATMLKPSALPYHIRLLFYLGNGFFPVVPMVIHGGISMIVGVLWNDRRAAIGIVAPLGFVPVHFLKTKFLACAIIFNALSGPAELVIMLYASMAVLHVPVIRGVARFFGVIGQFSLCSFILHRIAIQVVRAMMIRTGVEVPQEVEYALLVGLTMGCLWLVCEIRIKFPSVDALLKKMFV
jgi:hypothetical protein